MKGNIYLKDTKYTKSNLQLQNQEEIKTFFLFKGTSHPFYLFRFLFTSEHLLTFFLYKVSGN